VEELLRELLEQAAETRNLEYKGPMAWEGKAASGELIRDIMCFANTPDGGRILIGVAEGASGWVRAGITQEQATTFDPTKIGDLASGYCPVLPVFRVHRVSVDGSLYVLIVVDEFADQPIVCTKDLHGPQNEVILRAGAIYTRTVDAKCTEIRGAEEMQRLLDLAVRKRGDALLAQVASLFGGRRGVQLPPTDEERFGQQLSSAEDFFEDGGLTGPSWRVGIRPERFTERAVGRRSELTRLRDDAEVALRGWNFPHVERQGSGAFSDGIQSLTRFQYHHEAHRVYFSGLFVWKGLIREEYEKNLQGRLLYLSTIWSFTEIWLFASRFMSSLLEGGGVVVDIGISGLRGRELVPGRADISLFGAEPCGEDAFRQRLAMPLGELRARHLEHAAAGAIDLFELFGVSVSPEVIRSFQERLLRREF
jgi:hypothetical protein